MTKSILFLLLSAVGAVAAPVDYSAPAGSAGLVVDSTVQITQNGATPTAFPNAPLVMTCNINGACQEVLQNQSNGTNATGDMVLTSDLGANTSYYLDLFINSSKYSQSGFSVEDSSGAGLQTSDMPLYIWSDINGGANSGYGHVIIGSSNPVSGNKSVDISSNAVAITPPSFTVGVSTFAVLNSSVGIRTANPLYALHNAGDTYTAGTEIVGGTFTVIGNKFSVGGSSFIVNGGQVVISTGPTYNGGVPTDQGDVTLNVIGIASAAFLSVGGSSLGSCSRPALYNGTTSRTSGFYWATTSQNNIGMCSNGTEAARFTGNGISGGANNAGNAEMNTAANSLTAVGHGFVSDLGSGMTGLTVQGDVGLVSSTTLLVAWQTSGSSSPATGSVTVLSQLSGTGSANKIVNTTTTFQSGQTPTGYVIGVSSQDATSRMFGVAGNGVVASSGTTPTISCTAGTGAMLANSNNNSGSFTSGTGATGCTVTFSQSGWNKIPSCIPTTNAAVPIALSVTAISGTAFTVTAAAAMTGDTIYYVCWGAP